MHAHLDCLKGCSALQLLLQFHLHQARIGPPDGYLPGSAISHANHSLIPCQFHPFLPEMSFVTWKAITRHSSYCNCIKAPLGVPAFVLGNQQQMCLGNPSIQETRKEMVMMGFEVASDTCMKTGLASTSAACCAHSACCMFGGHELNTLQTCKAGLFDNLLLS